MKKTTKSKKFIGAMMIGFSLLLAGCSQPAGGGPEPKIYTDDILENPDWTVLNKSAISFDNHTGAYTFDGRQQTGGIKRTITSDEPIVLSFKIKTHLYEQYDGVLRLFIDNQLVNFYTGTNGIWRNQQIDIPAGEHTFEWIRYDTDPDHTDFNAHNEPEAFISLKDINFKGKNDSIISMNKDQSFNVPADIWVATGFYSELVDKDLVLAKFPQYGDALVDTHGKVIRLAHSITENNKTIGDNSYLIIKDIQVSTEATLSFDYKCDLLNWIDENGTLHRNYFKVFIDDNTTESYYAFGNGQMWQNASINLSSGTHTVTFVAGTDDWWYSSGLTNSVYLDNITLVPNTIASVDIYPKGVQDTYVNGDSIQFTAKALRADGSVIPDKTVSWSSTGGSIDSDGLFTPGTSAGTFSVTATIDGITSSNNTVKVHGSDYLTEPVTINGHTFTGKITPIDNVIRTDTNNITFSDPTPKYSNFTTDGFFVIKGTAKDTCAFVRVVKLDNDDTTYKEYDWNAKYINYYIIRPGDFEQRIWLRFGDGDYDVGIFEASVDFYEDYDGYEGAYKYASWEGDNVPGSYTWFHVRNSTTFNQSPDDCTYLLPSYYIQCDDFLITNAFNAVMAELPENATLGQKLQALYDWEARRSHYDYVSFTDTSTTKRKRQDAVHVLKYGMGVCEGYADLYTAFARLLGVKAAYQSSAKLNHAWTELYYKNQWKMVDLTWDDSYGNAVAENVEKNPTAENYWYFLINRKDSSHAPNDNVTDFHRSAISNISDYLSYDRY